MASHTFPLTSHGARSQQWQWRIGIITLILVSLIGMISFLSPFWAKTITSADLNNAHLTDSPLITAILSAACLIVVFANLGPALSSKSIALLGVLVGINVMLRAVKVTFFVMLGEASPVFMLIALVGYVFGGQMGFLMGALTLLCSAFVTGGVGPWLPFQMFCAGWMGLTASWLRPGSNATVRREVIKLAIFGFIWGFLYGIIINLYFWPFTVGDSATSWTPGYSLSETLTRYIAFYFVQSIGADFTRATGNAVLLLTLGVPLLQVFRRFRTRFAYTVVDNVVE